VYCKSSVALDIRVPKWLNTMQASSLCIMEEENTIDDKIVHASSIIAAAKGKIKIRAAMRLVGFTDAETKNMTTYQQVRRKSTNMIVVDKKALPKATVPQQIGDGAETVASTLSSAERNDAITETGSTSNNSTAANTVRTVATPRRLLGSDSSAPTTNTTDSTKRSGDVVGGTPKKKHRRTSVEVQREQANVVMKTKKETQAMKLATVRIQQNKELPINHPDKKSINDVVAEVNELCESNISPKTAATYVRKGLIDTSPLKRGTCGAFSKAVFASLKGAYATFLMLEQAESKQPSSMKEMSQRVNACVNKAGHTKSRDDLARKLRKETAHLFDVGKANMTEQRRLQWTNFHNLNLWFSSFKTTLIELGFGR